MVSFRTKTNDRPEAATLTTLSPSLLTPDVLPELWQTTELRLEDLYDYFAGRVVKMQREGYEESVTIPRAERSVVDAAVQAAVKEKRLWLISGTGSFFAEELPMGVLTDDAYLQRPPQPIPATEILPQSLPEAWNSEITTALEIANALSTKVGKMLPWATVRDALDGAFRARLLERTFDSGSWPCDYAGARSVRMCMPREQPAQPSVRESRSLATSGMLVAEAPVEIEEIQNLNDQLSEITRATVGLGLKFYLRVELGSASQVSDETIARVNELLYEVSDKLRLQRE